MPRSAWARLAASTPPCRRHSMAVGPCPYSTRVGWVGKKFGWLVSDRDRGRCASGRSQAGLGGCGCELVGVRGVPEAWSCSCFLACAQVRRVQSPATGPDLCLRPLARLRPRRCLNGGRIPVTYYLVLDRFSAHRLPRLHELHQADWRPPAAPASHATSFRCPSHQLAAMLRVY